MRWRRGRFTRAATGAPPRSLFDYRNLGSSRNKPSRSRPGSVHGGDGRRNIWSDLDDVFASTANYLAASKYVHNARWGVEVTVPEGFDYSLADADTRKAVIEWAAAGVAGAYASRT